MGLYTVISLTLVISVLSSNTQTASSSSSLSPPSFSLSPSLSSLSSSGIRSYHTSKGEEYRSIMRDYMQKMKMSDEVRKGIFIDLYGHGNNYRRQRRMFKVRRRARKSHQFEVS